MMMFETKKLLIPLLVFIYSTLCFASTNATDNQLSRLMEELEAAQQEQQMILAGQNSRGANPEQVQEINQLNARLRLLEDELAAAEREQALIRAGSARHGPTAEEITEYRRRQAELQRVQEELEAAITEEAMIEAGKSQRFPSAQDYQAYQRETQLRLTRLEEELAAAEREEALIRAGQASRGATFEEIRIFQQQQRERLARLEEEEAAAQREQDLIRAGQARRGPTAAEYNAYQYGLAQGRREAERDHETVVAEQPAAEVIPEAEPEEPVVAGAGTVLADEKAQIVIINNGSGDINISGGILNTGVVAATGEPAAEPAADPAARPQEVRAPATETETETEREEAPAFEEGQSCFDLDRNYDIEVHLCAQCIASVGGQTVVDEAIALDQSELGNFISRFLREDAIDNVLLEMRTDELSAVFGAANELSHEGQQDYQLVLEKFRNNDCTITNEELQTIDNEEQITLLNTICGRTKCYYNHNEESRTRMQQIINSLDDENVNVHEDAIRAIKVSICQDCRDYAPPEETPEEEPAAETEPEEETQPEPEVAPTETEEEEVVVPPVLPPAQHPEVIPFRPQMVPFQLPSKPPMMWPGIVI